MIAREVEAQFIFVFQSMSALMHQFIAVGATDKPVYDLT